MFWMTLSIALVPLLVVCAIIRWPMKRPSMFRVAWHNPCDDSTAIQRFLFWLVWAAIVVTLFAVSVLSVLREAST